MHHRLDLPYLDTSAEQLRWSLDHDALPALAAARPVGFPMQLRILGASHQVVLSRAGLPDLIETVACVPGVATPLPSPGVSRALEGGLTYDLTTTVVELSAADLRARVDQLLTDLRGRRGALSASFPGNSYAVTALHAETGVDGEVRWRTWHAYPQHGQVVSTRTHIRLTNPASPASPAAPAALQEEVPCDAR
ncbi:hypothetical protein JNB_08584 [Janibacter sp. HTCC2649]|uniref:DUF2617 family protein n=1 Tax=Janibacter sp. HTCC2649 TaxID=313589 RepID=UPI0000670973|nr:DUF2617 family protein [Janibacter sp. HTCC2649]EAQ00214.1 hypothetical protein JNB_08584 [Janibacter sp. HTCC2649]